MIEFLPALQLAVMALKIAKDIIPQILEHGDRCRELVDRCEKLIVSVCDNPHNATNESLDEQLESVRVACIHVRETVTRLSTIHPIARPFRKEHIDEEFTRCERHLQQAFDIFNVGAQAVHLRQQEELARTLQQDRDRIFRYLDHLLERSRARAREIESRPTISPTRMYRPQLSSPQPSERGTQYYTPPITPANSNSLYIEERELQWLPEAPTFQEGTIGKVICKRLRGENVAVKYVNEDVHNILLGNRDNKQTFQRHVLKWSKVVHPHVCRFVGACIDVEIDGAFLVTEYCSKGNVMNYIRSHDGVNKLSLLHQTSKGMRYLHHLKIVHGNLKPSNILVRYDHRVVIHDFGLVKLRNDALRPSSASRHHAHGNWNYMSPEYLDGRIDYPSDVYSFAMSAWHMYTGHVPYEGIAWGQLRRVIISSRPDRPGSMNDPLWLHLQQWWAGDADLRPTFAVIEPALQAFLEPAPPRNIPLPERQQVPPPLPPLRVIPLEAGPSNHSGFTTPVSPSMPRRAIPLSETSRRAVSKVVYAFSSPEPTSYERLTKEILGHYSYWLKTSPQELEFQARERTDHGTYAFLDSSTRSAVHRFTDAVKAWINGIPHFKDEVPEFDPRRVLLFVIALTIMAERSFIQEVPSPHRLVDAFIKFNLARADFKAFLEKEVKRIWIEHKPSKFYDLATVAAQVCLVVERGFDILNTPL